MLHSEAKQKWGMALAVMGLLLPFADKAFHIDDPLFVWTARQILRHPFDFYGFSLNWNGLVEPAYRIIQNPPLNGYLIAAAAAFFGETEIAVHAGMSLAALAAVFGVYRLARQLTQSPAWTALFAAATPAFWISATGAMADVPLLALYVWALALWIEALAEDRPGKAMAAGGLAALACLTKYFGLTLVPLMAFHALATGKFKPRWLAGLLLPLAAVAGYQLLTWFLYGRALFFDAASYTLGFAGGRGGIVSRALQCLAFVGGGLAGLIFLAPLLHRGRVLAVGGAFAAALVMLAFGLESNGVIEVGALSGLSGSVRLQFWILAAAGAYLIGMATAEASNRRDAASLTLLLAVYGTFFFAAYLNWTINARIILPMAPAVAVLLLGRTPLKAAAMRPTATAMALALAVLFSLPFCLADYRFAGNQRRAAADLHQTLSHRHASIWFQGHWGFQYYMQQKGARPLDYDDTVIRANDIVVVPSNNTLTTALPPDAFHVAGTLRYAGFSWAATMNSDVGAGFYAAEWGPLPYAVGLSPPDRFTVYLAGRFENPESAVTPLARLLSEASR